jgi:hypothetical protein
LIPRKQSWCECHCVFICTENTHQSTSWEKPNYPAYFFLDEELPKKYLKQQGSHKDKAVYDVVVGSKRAPSAVTSYPKSTKDFGGLFTIAFGAMDAWFEEEEQIFVHCKDPYKVRYIFTILPSLLY